MEKEEIIIKLINDENRDSIRETFARFKFRMQLGEEPKTEAEILADLKNLTDSELWQARLLMIAHGMAALRYAT